MTYHWSSWPYLMVPIMLLILELISAQVVAKEAPSSSPAAALMEDFWQWKINNYPEFAIKIGIKDKRISGRLDNRTMEDFKQKKKEISEFIKKAGQLSTPNSEDVLSINIFIEELQQFLKNSQYIKYTSPVTYMEGPQSRLKSLVEDYLSFNTYKDYANLLDMYSQFPVQIEEYITLMKGNIASGLMPSNWSIGGVVDQLENLESPMSKIFLYKPFIRFPQGLFEDEKEQLIVSAGDAIENKVLPAFKKLKLFILEEYLPACRGSIGVSSLPRGQEFYQVCLDYHTSTKLTAQQIHDIGLKEVQKIVENAKKTAAEVGLGGMSIADIKLALQAEPSQKFSSLQEVLNAFENTAYKEIFPLLKNFFHHMPPPNVTFKAEDDPSYGERYSDPTGDRLGTFRFNGPLATDIYRKYLITALTLHETAPGHHLHVTYLLENYPSVPEFRKKIDYTRYNSIPATFTLNTAFLEGWGLYSEYLGEEFGLYKDPYKKLGRYSYELLRACRLVVDTGIHALGWSRDKALKYLMDNTFAAESYLNNQINRYITWPGQATAYKIGEIKIKELRKKAENMLESKFDIKDFHDTLLKCFGPFAYVEKCVDEYIRKCLKC